jgi:peptidoglycan/LPS O-acetylase OafA/YrhL
VNGTFGVDHGVTIVEPSPSETAAAAGRRPRHRFRTDIEGLRAVAVLSVVAGHAGIGLFSGGYVGVDVFFVISGFLITLHLLRELDATAAIGFRAFYGRRAVRLLPAASLTVLATLAAARHWMSPSAAKAVAVDAITSAFSGINLRLAVQGTEYLTADREPSPLQHFWSLAVEEQFYLVWPLLLATVLMSRRTKRSVALVLGGVVGVSLLLCVVQTWWSPSWAYFGPQSRIWELAVGALVALGAERLGRLQTSVAACCSWIGLAAIALSCVVFTSGTAFPGIAAVLPVSGAALVIAGGCAPKARGARTVLDAGPMQAIGQLSYSWYLWHWPVLTLAPYVIGHPIGAFAKTVLALASLGPAWLSLVFVENRVRFSPAFRRHPEQGVALGITLAIVMVVSAVGFLLYPQSVKGSGTADSAKAVVASARQLSAAREQLLELIQTSARTTQLPDNLVPALDQASTNTPKDKGCLASLDETSAEPAIRLGCDKHGDTGSRTTLVLFGDSHAEQWFDAVDAVARLRHWRLVVLAKSGCTPAQALTIRINTRRAFTECQTWREDAFRVLRDLKPKYVLVTGRNYSNAPVTEDGKHVKGRLENLWADALLATVGRIQALGARPIIMQDTPDPVSVDIPDCVAAHPAAVQKCGLPIRKAIPDNRRAAIAAMAAAAGVEVIDPKPWFCADVVCPVIVGDTLVYRDGSHATAAYVSLLTPLLEGELTG